MAGGRYLQCTFYVRIFFLFTYTCTCSKSGRASCVQCLMSPPGCQSWVEEIVRGALYPLQIHPTGTGCAILVAPSCWGCSGRSWQWQFVSFDPWQAMTTMEKTEGHSQHEAGAMPVCTTLPGPVSKACISICKNQPSLQQESGVNLCILPTS